MENFSEYVNYSWLRQELEEPRPVIIRKNERDVSETEKKCAELTRKRIQKYLRSMVALKEQDYDKYARKMKKYLKWELSILDDFLLHTITDEREIKILLELLEKRNAQRKSIIVCSQRDPDNWKAMILNDEVSANSIMKRATKHYTIKINTR